MEGRRRVMGHGWKILGYVLWGLGLFSFITIKVENLGIKWPAWERGEQAGAFVCGIAFLAGIFLAVLGCGGSQPEVVGPRDLATSQQIGWTIVVGLIFYVVGAISWAKKSLACRWCETVSKVGLVICLAGLVGFFLLSSGGCGGSQPQSTDPVTVEVTVCDSALGGTAGEYLRLKTWRQAEGICEESLESSEDRQQAIREATERDVADLDRELDRYLASHRTDCYNGPVFNEMERLVEEKRQNGTLCREP